ncbi:hypothetical protein BJ322DRAFT_1104126 [Thelephora terrestris]|uniref:Rieske domain-containing protein n=1 Tax=Thelephora terrestris TaxID=56493 RepID=A0A9P6HNM5_9AGAM|nr:hypothetical protein BJ322DRAFT_1104126 [Thelephora terrestris]
MVSTKTIPVCDEASLNDGEMKEVEFGSGKVLLARIGEKVHATSAYCSHYGAQLANGVLVADGRVVCPWHGACFNVCTGDIEDAPAPAAIHSFKTSVSNGKIYVTADEERVSKPNMSRSPKVSSNPDGGMASGNAGVVIVGGGSGAFHSILSLRENGYIGPITVVSKEPHSPIDRTKLSKSLATDASKLEWRTAADLRIKFGVTLRTSTTVTSINIVGKQIVLEGGKEFIHYDKLILAPGSQPKRLPIPGADLENVFTFRGISDSIKVDAAAKEGKKLIVIGSSFIGLEIAVTVLPRKLASIDIIGRTNVPFEPVLGKDVGAAIQKFHESKGIKFHLGSTVERIIASESDPKFATGVEITNKEGEKEVIEADFVVLGVGVSPATEFLKQSEGFPQAALQKDGGVRVDEYLKVRGLDDVFAIGDIAVYPRIPYGGETRIEHWNVAGNHGRAVGKTISGSPVPFSKVPIFWSGQGQNLRYCGIGAGYDDVIIDGSLDELKFTAYYAKEDTIVAVAAMQNDPIVSRASELMRIGLMPTPEQVRAGLNLSTIDISSSKAPILSPCASA